MIRSSTGAKQKNQKKNKEKKKERHKRRVIRWRQVSRDGTVEEQNGRTKQGEAKGGEKRERGAPFEATARLSAINI